MTPRIKVVHLITGLGPGGAEMMLYKLVSRMSRQHFENVVVSLGQPGIIGTLIEQAGVPVRALGMPRRRVTLGGAGQLLRLLAAERPAVLQTWMYHADLLGLLAGRMTRTSPIIWNVRCSSMHGLSPLTARIVRMCARLSHMPNAAVVNSESGLRDHTALGYRARRWEVIPNGFDLARFAPDPSARASVRAELGLAPDTLLIGLIGRYNPMKDHGLFLRAALAQARPGLHFLLAGSQVEPSNPALARVVAGHPAAGHIHMLGERTDIARLMAALDVATSSSAYGEGFANVIGEAMACGVPVVVTNVGDAAAIVGAAGVVVPPRDQPALERAWQHLIAAGPAERTALGAAGRARVQQHYSLERIVRRYEELYMAMA